MGVPLIIMDAEKKNEKEIHLIFRHLLEISNEAEHLEVFHYLLNDSQHR